MMGMEFKGDILAPVVSLWKVPNPQKARNPQKAWNPQKARNPQKAWNPQKVLNPLSLRNPEAGKMEKNIVEKIKFSEMDMEWT